MLSIKPFTSYNIVDILNKPLYFIESDQLNVCNLISPDDLSFFQEYYNDYYTEIVYFEYERPLCPKCNISMNSNGSRPAKPNKWEGIRKKQYICFLGKNQCTFANPPVKWTKKSYKYMDFSRFVN